MRKRTFEMENGDMMTRYDIWRFAIFDDGDGCVEILGPKRFRLMLFWPPAFSLWIGRFNVEWNVFRKLWFNFYLMPKREKETIR